MKVSGEAPTPSPKIISVSGPKNEPKTSPFYLLVLAMTIFPFLIQVDERVQSLQSRRFEASARPGRGHASDAKPVWHKHKARLTETRNYIILLLKSQKGSTWSSWQLCCLELQRRETMEIRTKYFGAGFEAILEAGLEAGLEGLKYGNWSKTIWQRRSLFCSSKRKKKQARKNGPPQFKIPAAAAAGQINFNLK